MKLIVLAEEIPKWRYYKLVFIFSDVQYDIDLAISPVMTDNQHMF